MFSNLKNNLYIKKNQKEIAEILMNEDFSRIANIKPTKINRVIIVVRRILPYSGGYTSILRLGTELCNNGFDVYYAIISKYQNTNDADKCAKKNLKSYKGKMVDYNKLTTSQNDVIIATYWKTVYQTKKIDGYKMYFVQDYEPYFSQYGENFLLAKKTYELGYHMVSLGQWNKYMIEKDTFDTVDYIEFPFEPSEYRFIKRNYLSYTEKQDFTIAAFIKEDQKRIPNIVISILSNLKEEFASYGYTLHIKYFGINKKKKIPNGINLGVLNKEELLNLYKSSDFGICASMTNVSLVPYEMQATGLPLIEFKDGTYPFFFPKETAIITDFDYKQLCEKMINVINNPIILEKYNENASDFMKSLSWNNSGKQFSNILHSIEEYNKTR